MSKQTILGLIGYLFIGTGVVLAPSVMPFITAEFAAKGVSLAAAGLIFTAGAAGGILGNLLAGFGSDLIGRRRLVWIAALLLAISLGLAASAQLWLLFVITFVFISGTQGALSTGINALVTDANRGSRARALNILHGVYGVGATVSPLVIGYLLDKGLYWRWALGGTGVIWLCYGIVSWLLTRNDDAKELIVGKQKLDLGMLRQRPFLALFAMGFIYNGVAVSLLGWITVFMKQSEGFSTLFSVSMISIFYLALTSGRFLCALFSEKIGYARTLLILAIGITVTYPIVFLGLRSLLVVAGIFLTGLSFSGLFPTALAYGSRLYPEQSGTLSGTLSVALTLGSMIPPLWTGVIAERWGFQTALGINYLLVLPMIGLALYLGKVEYGKVGEPVIS